jgi:erythromycin esterase-like protein/predicted phosphoribosyltransferase/dienelactone hydrolase
MPLFIDRRDAGRQLASRLKALNLAEPVVYALPRGGVPLAVEIAEALKAPMDLVLVRKIGAPGQPELALAAVVDGEDARTVVNEAVGELTGSNAAYLEKARRRELDEIERRRTLYFGERRRVSPAGRTAIVVDDGLATGATAKAALRALRRQGAVKVVLAVPIAPQDTVEKMRAEADVVVCLHTPQRFFGVGAFYSDFHQLSDEETLGLLRQVWDREEAASFRGVEQRTVRLPPLGLTGDLQTPAAPHGIIVFAHGSGSGRLSPRNRAVADDLNARGFATLLFDLLADSEAQDRSKVFDIALLADRLRHAVSWIEKQPDLADLALGLFGASTGAAAALVAGATLGVRVRAIVSRGGRPDLAGSALRRVTAATLLIVGADDVGVIDLNREALAVMSCDKAMKLVPGATHLFEEPGTLEKVMKMAGDWFITKLGTRAVSAGPVSETRALTLTPAARLTAAAEPLPDIDDGAFAAAFDRYADCRVVLLGEASHGTSEFYRARASITRRLVEKHGFDIIAVEADWPDAAAIDRHVRLGPHRKMTPPPFSRFPTWMWRNSDVEAFVRWLRDYNAIRPAPLRAAFYGLDLYNMRASMAAVLEYLDKVDPGAAAEARERYACLAPWSSEPAAYGRASLSEGYAICERPVLGILGDLARKSVEYTVHDGEGFFDATENARLVADAERYYRVMYYGAHESWNLRDQHMFDTLARILAARGPASKAVVWAHNSHIGDARYTEMGAARGELNIGQLCRQRFGHSAALIGFGTHSGTVMAASDWDEPAEVKTVRPSRSDSYEGLCHDTGIGRFLVDLRPGHNEALRDALREPRLERYIGVIYRPDTERMSHYSQASLPEQYDGFVWFDKSHAVTPLTTPIQGGEDETYPFGL